MTDSLIIKDGAGSIKNLTVESGSYGYVPVHTISSSAGSGSYVTASAAYPVYVTGNVSISQPVNVDVVVGDNIAVTASQTNPVYITGSVTSTPSIPLAASITSISSSVIDWSIPTSGTAIASSVDYNRKGLLIFNPGPNNVYLAVCSTVTITNGFTLSSTSSAPDAYSFILYPSGTYVADSTTATMAHGVYYISGAANDKLFVTITY